MDEKSKLPKKSDDPLPSCENCTMQSNMGLPCYHMIRERQQNPGVILLSDIDSHWLYDRDVTVLQRDRQILLEPAPVKGKGRPRRTKDTKLVAKGDILKKISKNKEDGGSSTRRDPSAFEYAGYLPLSIASPQYHLNSQMSINSTVIPRKCVLNCGLSDDVEDLTTTALGLFWGAGGDEDLIEPGTAAQGAYMRSLKLDQLIAADVERLEGNAYVNADITTNPQEQQRYKWE